ncbi:hypothetical protein GLYMA_19G084650v4 [Glycine max]|nr:hypothetical protein GLYMA_19G084650v4 [Glycine max]KAH1076922.1 hypothetical protein GYH30_052435 [Glycine max]
MSHHQITCHFLTYLIFLLKTIKTKFLKNIKN